MRLKEDNNSWRSRGIMRRDYRHTYGESEIPKHHKKGGKKRPKKIKLDHKHVWVEVDYKEYERYADRHSWSWWWQTNMEPPFWAEYTTYFVCAECLATKKKVDEGRRRARRRRARYRREYGKRKPR